MGGDDLRKINERFSLLLRSADRVCRDLNASLELNPTTEHFAVDQTALNRAIVDYFDRVEALKADNTLKGLINRPKQAALTALALLNNQPIKALGNVPDTVHLAMANQVLALHVGVNLIGARLDRIGITVQEDMLWLLARTSVPERVVMQVSDLLERLSRCRNASFLAHLSARLRRDVVA
ncbi:MAG: hypothetical protein RLY86_1170 [Pseudomonadota bacterium]|jgi:hypothetical protein